MEDLKLQKKSYYKVRAFIYDFFQKTFDKQDFQMQNLISHHGVNSGIPQCFEHKKIQGKYCWVGNPPTDEDIIIIANKLYERDKIKFDKYKESKNVIELEFDTDLTSLKNQMAILQEMFNRFE